MKNKKILYSGLAVTMAVGAMLLGGTAMAREQLAKGQEGKMLNVVCQGKAEDRQSMRDLITILSGRINITRVQLTRGNCYLATGKVSGGRYLGLYDPVSLDELYYIIK